MKKENSKEAILACALELFAEKGYEAVSPNEIVERVGVKKPTLYYFFGSKEGLFDELLRVNYGKLDALLAEACTYHPHIGDYDRDVRPTLLGVVNALFGFAKDNAAFYLMTLSISLAPPSSKSATLSEKYHANHYVALERTFCDISAAHTNLKGKERIHSRYFLAMVNAQIGFWYRGLGDLDENAAQLIVNGFMHGIFS